MGDFTMTSSSSIAPNLLFISFSTKDKTFVQSLANNLKALGLDPWYFLENERIGEFYPTKLMEVIGKAHAIILILSSQSANSHPVWQEIHYASLHRKQMMIIELDACEGAVPFSTSGIHKIICHDQRNCSMEVLKDLADPAVITRGIPTEYAELRVLPLYEQYANRKYVPLPVPSGWHPLDLPAEQIICSLGRDPLNNQLTLSLEGISREQANIRVRLDLEHIDYILTDHSRFGTYINGTKIEAPYTLQHGDQIGLGNKYSMLTFTRLSATIPPLATRVLRDE
jgi:hypothetical protein